MIEALQRDVDELKAQRIGGTPAGEALSEESASELASPPATHHDEGPWDHSASSPTADVTPSVTTDVPREPTSTSTARVRIAETPDLAGRYDVDADEAPLHEFLTKLGPVAGWNLVCGPEMQGTVHCRWKGVELKPALNQLLKVHNWQVREEGDFAIVEPLPRPVSSVQTEDHSTASITLDLSPDTSTQRPWINEPEYDTFNTPAPRLSDSRPSPFQTDPEPSRMEARPISFGSGGRAAPRRGRIVMADYPELMSPGTPPDNPQAEAPQWVEIEATILEIRQAAAGPRGVFRRALSVAGQGPCPLCGVIHDGPVGQVGHSVEGWFELEDGIQAGVCPMTPDLITTTLQKHSTTTVTATPRVHILSRQLAEIALTEQPGYRRHLVREKPESAEVQLLPGVKITLRPTVGENGLIRLDLRPSSVASEEFSASLNVPPSSCVVLGGLDFVRDPATPPAAEDLYEVVVLIQVRPRENSRLSPLETPATRPPRYAAPSSQIEPPR